MESSPLFQQLMQRQMGKPQAFPSSPPPNPPSRVPPAAERWANAQKIQEAYANNWQPNPVLLQAALKQ